MMSLYANMCGGGFTFTVFRHKFPSSTNDSQWPIADDASAEVLSALCDLISRWFYGTFMAGNIRATYRKMFCRATKKKLHLFGAFYGQSVDRTTEPFL